MVVSEVRLVLLPSNHTTGAQDSALYSVAPTTCHWHRSRSNETFVCARELPAPGNADSCASGAVHLFRDATLKSALISATMQSTVLRVSPARSFRMISCRGSQDRRPERAARCAAAQLPRRLPPRPCCTNAAQVGTLTPMRLRGVSPYSQSHVLVLERLVEQNWSEGAAKSP